MRRNGFTLIEVLISLVLLSIGLLALTQMSTTYIRANVKTQDLTDGALLASEKMEQLRQYATSEPNYESVFGFNYLTSTLAAYSSILDPPGSTTVKTISGLLSGAAGTPVTTTSGTTFEVLTAAGGGAYTATDVKTTATGAQVTRVWSVRPIQTTVNGATATDNAELVVTATWTDKFNTPHTATMRSLVHRRK